MNSSTWKFWLCCALVLVNLVVAGVAPTQDLELNALLTAGICGAAALLFWVLDNSTEGQS